MFPIRSNEIFLCPKLFGILNKFMFKLISGLKEKGVIVVKSRALLVQWSRFLKKAV